MKKQLRTIGMAMLMGITAIVFNGCRGNDGAPGPQGAPGNANVWTSTGTTINNSWSFDSGYNEWYTTFNVNDISSDVVSTGTVQVFLGDGSGTSWSAMPYAFQGTEFNYTYSYGQVEIEVTLSDGSAPVNPGGVQFKFVVIPSRMMKLHPNVNLKNYEEVKKAFNLK